MISAVCPPSPLMRTTSDSGEKNKTKMNLCLLFPAYPGNWVGIQNPHMGKTTKACMYTAVAVRSRIRLLFFSFFFFFFYFFWLIRARPISKKRWRVFRRSNCLDGPCKPPAPLDDDDDGFPSSNTFPSNVHFILLLFWLCDDVRWWGYNNNNNNMSAGSSIYSSETWDEISRILLTRQSPSIIRASSFPTENATAFNNEIEI